MHRAAVTITVAALALGAATGVAVSAGPDGELPRGSETVHLDPADFSTDIDNRYWPMRPGSRWIYRETDSDGTRQKVVVTVTDQTRLIANGITARVVRDVVTQKGEFVEVTDDWYAQDTAGNIWYLGENTTEYDHGEPVSTAGSFEAGIDGAQAGVIMPAHPRPGLRYRQEYAKGQAEDKAGIVSRREQAEVPAAHYRRVLMTRDTNPLERDVLEFKFYAPGIGPVLALTVSGGSDREELISYKQG